MGLVDNLTTIKNSLYGTETTTVQGAIKSKAPSATATKLSEFPAAIMGISTGVDPSGATAVASDVATGKTFYAGNSTLKTGTATVLPAIPATADWVTLTNDTQYTAGADGWLYYRIESFPDMGTSVDLIFSNRAQSYYPVDFHIAGSAESSSIMYTTGVTPVFAGESFKLQYSGMTTSSTAFIKCSSGVASD